MAFKRSWVRSPPSPPSRKRTNLSDGTFSVLVLRETVRERTGRRSAERKKGAGGTLFSPRVDPLCTFTDNTNDIRKDGTFSVYLKILFLFFCINTSYPRKIYIHHHEVISC